METPKFTDDLLMKVSPERLDEASLALSQAIEEHVSKEDLARASAQMILCTSLIVTGGLHGKTGNVIIGFEHLQRLSNVLARKIPERVRRNAFSILHDA